jgi:molybdopterin synthase catalytic subunit/molybdopterin synthase sulfur carrier subunit
MNIKVLLFADARQRLGADSLVLLLPAGATVGDMRCELTRRFPELAALADRSRFAVNERIVGDATPLAVSDEVAWIPPVSGG